VQREHGRAAVDGLVLELDLETAFGLNPGTDFSGVGRCGAKPSAAVWRRAVADSAAADKYDGFVTGARPCV
jgi:hypothetical protein